MLRNRLTHVDSISPVVVREARLVHEDCVAHGDGHPKNRVDVDVEVAQARRAPALSVSRTPKTEEGFRVAFQSLIAGGIEATIRFDLSGNIAWLPLDVVALRPSTSAADGPDAKGEVSIGEVVLVA